MHKMVYWLGTTLSWNMEQTAKASEDQLFNYIWSSAELSEKEKLIINQKSILKKSHSYDQKEFSHIIVIPAFDHLAYFWQQIELDNRSWVCSNFLAP